MKRYACSLSELLRGVSSVPSVLDTRISGLSLDSRKVNKGDLFIALGSDESKVHEHIQQAITLGANAILVEGCDAGRVYEDGAAVEICIQNLESKAGMIADRFYRSPSKDLCVVGVTGTNGKTSVASYVANYIASGGRSCGIIGTLGYGLVGDHAEPLNVTGYTTPDVVAVHRHLAEMRDQGAQCVVMEVSSHGLCQHRVDAVSFEGAVFTNLTREHLDYHGSMKGYAEAKAKLFGVPGLKFAVINRDDQHVETIKAAISVETNVFSYSCVGQGAEISVLNKEISDAGVEALIKAPVGQIKIDSPLLGEFNLSNLLAVTGVAIALDDTVDLEKRIARILPVDGRMEVVRQARKPLVVIDYAHTPDALENVLETLRGNCQERLRLVFGCGGDRDRGKRAEMARIAERLADDLIITDDNPRGELPENIVADILVGIKDRAAVKVIHERRQAIQQVLEQATANDIVLVAGKGHERWQEVNGQRSYFSDIETVRELLLPLSNSEGPVEEVVHD